MEDRKKLNNKRLNPLKDLFESPVKINKSKFLSKKYGGEWTYIRGGACWDCNDGVRTVRRVAGCSCDDYCSHTPMYYLYGGGIPEVVWWY